MLQRILNTYKMQPSGMVKRLNLQLAVILSIMITTMTRQGTKLIP
jgi:hypothetical protein